MISCYELRLGNHVLADKNLQQVSMITGTSVFTIDAEESHEQELLNIVLTKLTGAADR
jgi:hypothetical protein